MINFPTSKLSTPGKTHCRDASRSKLSFSIRFVSLSSHFPNCAVFFALLFFFFFGRCAMDGHGNASFRCSLLWANTHTHTQPPYPHTHKRIQKHTETYIQTFKHPCIHCYDGVIENPIPNFPPPPCSSVCVHVGDLTQPPEWWLADAEY